MREHWQKSFLIYLFHLPYRNPCMGSKDLVFHVRSISRPLCLLLWIRGLLSLFLFFVGLKRRLNHLSVDGIFLSKFSPRGFSSISFFSPILEDCHSSFQHNPIQIVGEGGNVVSTLGTTTKWEAKVRFLLRGIGLLSMSSSTSRRSTVWNSQIIVDDDDIIKGLSKDKDELVYSLSRTFKLLHLYFGVFEVVDHDWILDLIVDTLLYNTKKEWFKFDIVQSKCVKIVVNHDFTGLFKAKAILVW